MPGMDDVTHTMRLGAASLLPMHWGLDLGELATDTLDVDRDRSVADVDSYPLKHGPISLCSRVFRCNSIWKAATGPAASCDRSTRRCAV